jgi:tRNA/tmRNA/rRNA uracil-C5-methylase (TrmA/RlmC/RlmD family)
MTSPTRRTQRHTHGARARQEAAPAARPSLVGRRIEAEVDAVAHGGSCVARVEGQVVFVRHALPGELVVAEVTEGREGDRYLRADAVEVLRASADRVQAPCPYAGPGRCGGCDWQHATPEAQRRLKAQVIAEQLHRLAGIDREVTVTALPDPEGAEPYLGWRTRVQFAVDESGRLGLRRHRSHEVISVTHCPIATREVEAVGAERRDWPGMAGVEVIAATGSSDRAVIVTPQRGERVPFVELDAEVSVLRGDGAGGTRRIHGRPHVRERSGDRTWRVTGSGFWQVHPEAAATLTETVLDLLRPAPGEIAFDLYCGVGLFAGALATAVGADGYVVAVEGDRTAVADAEYNLRDEPQVDVIEGPVHRVLAEGPADYRCDVLVLDPPRAGAGRDVVDEIGRLTPRAIAYVACDPAALARDLAWFGDVGYDLADLRAFDIFPMTHHVECVALLARREGAA